MAGRVTSRRETSAAGLAERGSSMKAEKAEHEVVARVMDLFGGDAPAVAVGGAGRAVGARRIHLVGVRKQEVGVLLGPLSH